MIHKTLNSGNFTSKKNLSYSHRMFNELQIHGKLHINSVSLTVWLSLSYGIFVIIFLIRWSIFCTFLNFIILKHTSITYTHTAASTLDFNRVYCQLSSRNIIISSLLSYLWSKLTHSDSFVCNINLL